jgi:hypothetical protein
MGIPAVLDAALADHEAGLARSVRVLATGEVLGDFVALARGCWTAPSRGWQTGSRHSATTRPMDSFERIERGTTEAALALVEGILSSRMS